MPSSRILVTGSRTWTDRQAIDRALATAWWDLGAHHGIILVSGHCETGADKLAEESWTAAGQKIGGLKVEPHPADWPTCAPSCKPGHRKVNRQGDEYCPSAGHRRNAEMVALGADLCLAFIRNASPGATGCADLAAKAGIPVRPFTQEDR